MIRCVNIYCGTVENITQHHLIPKPFRKGIIGRIERIYLCEDCHKKVHKMKTNTQLAFEYNTREAVIELLGSDRQFRADRIINSMGEKYEMQMVA